MTPDPCFEPREAATVAGLPDDHPLRRHARECPRCRALLDAYRAFSEADPGDVTPADLADADARLSRALADAIAVPAGGVAPTRAAAPGVRRAPAFWERLLHPAMRPAVGFAAIAIALGTMLLWPRLAPRPREVTLRGESRTATLVLRRAERSGGALHLEWNPVPGADGYELRLLSGQLAVLGTVGPLAGTTADLPLTGLGFRVAADETLLVRVTALAAGDPIATSEARLIERR